MFHSVLPATGLLLCFPPSLQSSFPVLVCLPAGKGTLPGITAYPLLQLPPWGVGPDLLLLLFFFFLFILPGYVVITLVLSGVWVLPVFSRCPEDCSICRCISEVLMGRGEIPPIPPSKTGMVETQGMIHPRKMPSQLCTRTTPFLYCLLSRWCAGSLYIFWLGLLTASFSIQPVLSFSSLAEAFFAS